MQDIEYWNEISREYYLTHNIPRCEHCHRTFADHTILHAHSHECELKPGIDPHNIPETSMLICVICQHFFTATAYPKHHRTCRKALEIQYNALPNFAGSPQIPIPPPYSAFGGKGGSALDPVVFNDKARAVIEKYMPKCPHTGCTQRVQPLMFLKHIQQHSSHVLHPRGISRPLLLSLSFSISVSLSLSLEI